MTTDLRSRIDSYRAAGYVKRWHTMPIVIGVQTDAEHSWQAATLLLLLHPSPSIELVQAVLWHDLAEYWVGDVPSPALRENQQLGAAYREAENTTFRKYLPEAAFVLTKIAFAFGDLDSAWLRAVDRLELALFAEDQLRVGNSLFRDPLRRVYQYMMVEQTTPIEVLDFMEKREWVEKPWLTTEGARSW